MCSLDERPIEALGEDIARLASQLAAQTCRFLLMVAAFDRRGGWHEAGQRSCAEWLAWRCALSPATAREHVRVAARLAELPRVTAAFRRGELSYSKVRALSRLEDVSSEPDVLRLARDATAAQLERIVQGYRSVVTLEGGAGRARSRRFVRLEPQDDGSVRLSGRLPAEEAAVLERALEQARRTLMRSAGDPPPTPDPAASPGAEGAVPASDQGTLPPGAAPPSDPVTPPLGAASPPDPATPPSEPTTPPGPATASHAPDARTEDETDPPLWHPTGRRAASTADALVHLADVLLRERPDEAADARRGARTSAERHQVVVHVDLPTLLAAEDRDAAVATAANRTWDPIPGTVTPPGGEDTAPDPKAEPGRDTPTPAARLADGVPIAPSVMRRLCCDGTLVSLVERGGETIHAGRRSRTVPGALRRALTARDGGCRFPGCRATTHLDAHHIEHWIDGGPTDRDNLVLLCRRHHTALHELGFGLARSADGGLVFRRPDGSVLAEHPPLPRTRGRQRGPRGRRLAPDGLAAGWGGPYDHPATVEAFLRHAPPQGEDPPGSGRPSDG